MSYSIKILNAFSIFYSKATSLILKYIKYINILFAGLILFTVFWSLNKGIVFADESFYLLHLQQPNGVVSFSEWPFYAQLIFPKDLLSIRILTVSLYILSLSILSYSIYRFKNNIPFLEIWTIGIIGMFSFYSPVQYVPNYVTFNIILITLGLGFFLLMLKTESLNKKYLFGILTGFSLGPLIFIMITNIPIFGIIFFMILVYSKNQKIKQLISVSVGILISILFFFLIVRSYTNYLSDLKLAIAYLANDQSHGNSSMLNWIIDVFIFAINNIIPPALLFFLSIYIVKNRYLKFVFFIIAILFLSKELRIHILYDYKNFNIPTTIFVLLLTVTLGALHKKQYQLFLILIFILSIPFFSALGTDVSFIIRSSAYMTPLCIFVFCMLKKGENSKLILPFYLFLLINLFRFLFIFPNNQGWNNFKLSEQTIPLKSIGINQKISLEEKRINTLKSLKAIIPINSKVSVSCNVLFGNLYLLSSKPLYLSYMFDEKNTIEALMKIKFKNESVFFIESIEEPFPSSLFQKLTLLNYNYTMTFNNQEIRLYQVNKN